MANLLVRRKGALSKEATVTTPTREQLLAAHNAYLAVWLAAAEKAHTEVMMEADKLRTKVYALQLNIVTRSCCKEDGGEDAT